MDNAEYDYFEDEDSELTKEVKTFVEILRGEICCEYNKGRRCQECIHKYHKCAYDYSGQQIFDEIERILENYNVLKARYLIANDNSFMLNDDAKKDIKDIIDYCFYEDRRYIGYDKREED